MLPIEEGGIGDALLAAGGAPETTRIPVQAVEESIVDSGAAVAEQLQSEGAIPPPPEVPEKPAKKKKEKKVRPPKAPKPPKPPKAPKDPNAKSALVPVLIAVIGLLLVLGGLAFAGLYFGIF